MVISYWFNKNEREDDDRIDHVYRGEVARGCNREERGDEDRGQLALQVFRASDFEVRGEKLQRAASQGERASRSTLYNGSQAGRRGGWTGQRPRARGSRPASRGGKGRR